MYNLPVFPVPSFFSDASKIVLTDKKWDDVLPGLAYQGFEPIIDDGNEVTWH